MYNARKTTKETPNESPFSYLMQDIATSYFKQWNTIQKMQKEVIEFTPENIASIIGEYIIESRQSKKTSIETYNKEINQLKEYMETKPEEAVRKLFIYKL